ncbi:protein translocase subunit SecF [Coprothermobacteraceae bacterium]|nr:protein translocase subunit SecF [Coprothermobacteraceae bacterium]
MNRLWLGFPWFEKLPFSVVQNRKKFYLASIVVIIVGLLFMGINYVRYGEILNLGVDFSGGVAFTVALPEGKNITDISKAASSAGISGAQIRSVGEGQFEVRAKVNEQQLGSLRTNLQTTASILDEYFVGPSVAASLIRNAVMSITVALAVLLLYISIRFKLKYGVAAILALVHDVIVTLAVFAVFFIPINSPFVAVLLILVGYSLQDSIVVLDRVREDRKLDKKLPIAEVVDAAIHQVFRRSLNTSITTLIAALALMAFAYRFLPDFTTGLVVGLITGTYSSIFIAASLLVDWGE